MPGTAHHLPSIAWLSTVALVATLSLAPVSAPIALTA